MASSRSNISKFDILDEIVIKTIAIENFDRRKKDWEKKVNAWAEEKRDVLRQKFRNKSFTETEFQDYMQKLDEKIEEQARVQAADRDGQEKSLQFGFKINKIFSKDNNIYLYKPIKDYVRYCRKFISVSMINLKLKNSFTAPQTTAH